MGKDYKSFKIEITDKNLTPTEALRMAKRKKKEKNIVNGSIYIDCPKVSDLFVIHYNSMRKCNDQEWIDYFYKFISPRKICKNGMTL